MAKKQAAEPVKKITRLRDLAEPGGRDILMFNPRKLTIDPSHNYRDYRLQANRDHLDSIKKSIMRRGVLKTLILRLESEQAIVTDGECRLRACLELMNEGKLPESFRIPGENRRGDNEKERLIDSIIANTGKNPSAWETGNALMRLERFGMTHEEMQEELGFTKQFIEQALNLSDAPEEVKAMLNEKAVSPQLAVIHIKKHGAKKATDTLKKAATAAKAAGKKTATAERTIGVNAYESLGKQIAKRLEQDGETDMIAEGKADDESVTVPYLLAKKLLDLYRGIKPTKGKK